MARRRSARPLVESLQLDQKYSRQVKSILQRSANDIDRQILAASEKGLNPITQIQLEQQRAVIKARLNQDWADIGRATAAGKLDAASAAARITTDSMSPLLSKILPDDTMAALIASEEARAQAGVEAVLARLQSSYHPLAESVYRNAALTSGQVDSMVNSALARGLSAKQFSREMYKYISPTAPGGMSYSALRLARTEINNAYHATTVARYQANGVIKKVDWNLSGSHPDYDECDLYAREKYPVDKVPEKPHPQCFCYITPSLPSEADFMRGLLGGSYDGFPWMVPPIRGGIALGAVATGGILVEQRIERLLARDFFGFIKHIAEGAKPINKYYINLGPARAGSLLALDPLETAKKGLDLYHAANEFGEASGLLARYNSGYRLVDVIPEGSNPVFVVELNDGTRAVVKQLGASGVKDEASREILSYKVLNAMGVRVPETILTEDGFLVQEFVDGTTGTNWYRAVTAPQTTNAKIAAFKSARDALPNSKEVGLFDWIVGNSDRHEGNWFVRNGELVPIDHGFAFSHTIGADGLIDYGLEFPNEFTEFALRFDAAGRMVGAERFTIPELRSVRESIVKLRPEFIKLGHEDWWQNTITVLDDVIDASKSPIAIAKQKELESLSLARWRKDVEELQDSLNSGYTIDQYGIQQGINETYKINFADGTFGIEKNIPMQEIQKEMVAFHGFRAMGVDRMPAIIIKPGIMRETTALERELIAIEQPLPYRGLILQSGGKYDINDYWVELEDGRYLEHLTHDELVEVLESQFAIFGKDPLQIVASGAESPKMIMRYAEGDIENGFAWGQRTASDWYDFASTAGGNTPQEVAEFKAAFPTPSIWEAYMRTEINNGREIPLFDFLFQNTDRHDGNWLFDKDAADAIPIDHGFLFGDGFWTGAAPNYRFRKGWIDDALNVTSLPDVYEVGRFGSKWSNGLPGPGMKFTAAELREVKRRLEKTQGYFLSIGKSDWYRQVMYNMNDLLGRAEIYEANALHTRDDVVKWAEAEYKRLNNLTMSYDEFQAAIKVAEKNLAKAEWYGYDVEEYIAREQLGLIPPVSQQEAADIAQWIQGGGRMGVRNLHLEAQDYVRNIEASRLRVQVYKDALAHEVERKLAEQEQTVVNLLRAQGWPDDLPEGITLKQYAERIVEAMTDPINGNFNPAMTVATFLRVRTQSILDLMSMAEDDVVWKQALKDALEFDPFKKVAAVEEAAPSGLIPHIEHDQTDKTITRQQRNALNEYGTFIGWNTKLRGIGEPMIAIANFEGKTQFIDQAIWNHPLAIAKTFVRAEADENAVARWQALAAQGSFHDPAYVSVIEKGKFFGTARGMEDLAAFIDNEWEAHAFVWVTYKLKAGDFALDMNGLGFDAYVPGEHLLPRDMRWKIVDAHHGIEQVEGIPTMVWHYTVEEAS